ncbi:hypothetical protein GCM10023321_19390 [Pseudonocardia eucalypti]|uniref:Resolvase/invertase-type recombinase catalytic domain-containing protein n=1 Tax=Pseudonocardia eucalypti TaxID=648755 RepID=A0ABP9PT76_9PSEU
MTDRGIDPPAPEAGSAFKLPHAPLRRPAGLVSARVPVSGPSGLSDYEVSPMGLPVELRRGEVRVAILSRCSTEDQQDPRQSMIRQVGNCRNALPEAWLVVAHFYDVESGRLVLDQRGQGSDYERFDIPIARDGGITDLLAEAARPDRRFDVVICESVSRVARRTFESLSIERELEQAGVPLFASNEPITLSGSWAQRILQRRINQTVAEWEVANTLEQSWGGLCTHVRDGWNIGKPCYGYRAKTYRHPNPTKAAKGLVKTRLEPDDARGETVTQIALWRYYEKIGYDTIADRLNADLDKYPPPEPTIKARARGVWGKTSIMEILQNPKYTGYQVFNRRASRSAGGKVNDPVKWVWSPEPVHEPLIPKWMYDEISARRWAKRGSRDSSEPNTHPATQRTYLLRGMLTHQCGRRMGGTMRNGHTYYLCYPAENNRARPDKYEGHPKTVYLRESALLDAISRFFAERVFGPYRQDLLTADLDTLDDRETRARQAERARLQKHIAKITRQQDSVLTQAQEGDPDEPFTKALRERYNNLEAEKTTALAVIAELDEADQAEPQRPTQDDVNLLTALPLLALDLRHAPEPLLRWLFEITKLNVQLHDNDEVTITITLPVDHLHEITHAAERIIEVIPSTRKTPGQEATHGNSVDAVRAPGGTRTHTEALLRGLPLPIGLRGHHVERAYSPISLYKTARRGQIEID